MKILFLLVFIPFCAFGQNFTQTDKLYHQSLKYHLSKSKIDTLFVLKDLDIALPETIKSTVVIHIDDLVDFMKSRKDLYAIRLNNLQAENGNVVIGLSVFFIEKKDNGEINLANLSNESFTYYYTTREKKYQLLKRRKTTI
jgi:hypothetical protein